MIIIKTFVPSYFKKFSCIADKCPDTCCMGWEVNLDPDSIERYRSVHGDFGKKLCSCLAVDEDGTDIFTLKENDRCPFLDCNKLCEIYANLGEDYLSETCTLFPRFYDDFASFREMGIGFGCPEAARIMLESEEPFSLELFEESEIEEAEVDEKFLNYLLLLREEMFKIFNGEESFKNKLKAVLLFAEKAQKEIEGEFYEENNNESDFNYCVDILSKMEYINPERKIAFQALKGNSFDKSVYETFKKDFECLMEYYIFRYMLKSVYDGDVLTKVKYGAFACAVVGRLYGKNPSDEDRIKAMYEFSKEVEYSDINLDILDEEMYERFGIQDLIELF